MLDICIYELKKKKKKVLRPPSPFVNGLGNCFEAMKSAVNATVLAGHFKKVMGFSLCTEPSRLNRDK